MNNKELKKSRLILGFTQKQLADLGRSDVMTINRIERGKRGQKRPNGFMWLSLDLMLYLKKRGMLSDYLDSR